MVIHFEPWTAWSMKGWIVGCHWYLLAILWGSETFDGLRLIDFQNPIYRSVFFFYFSEYLEFFWDQFQNQLFWYLLACLARRRRKFLIIFAVLHRFPFEFRAFRVKFDQRISRCSKNSRYSGIFQIGVPGIFWKIPGIYLEKKHWWYVAHWCDVKVCPNQTS